jgi:membrane fusion protein, multidrug efflux system
MENEALNDRMKKMLIIVGILFGCIFMYKVIMSVIIKYAMTHQSKAVSVSTIQVKNMLWQQKLKASGSVRAIYGVNVTTELAGMVKKIYFTPGTYVQEGEVLVQLNADSDVALLHALEANAALAKITYDRDKLQFAVHAVSKQVLDTDTENLKSLNAQVAQQAAIVLKKTIRAPFTGRLGICAVNPGQYVNPGDKIASLQTFNPIYVDFYMPQQTLSQLKLGQLVNVQTDSYPGKIFTGTITTVDPAFDEGTRNIEVEATLPNPQLQLTPGMFSAVEVDVGAPQYHLTVPQTAVSFNPFGDIVYVIKQTGQSKKGKPILTANQVFVVTGDTRGDQVAIIQGLHENDTVVTSGQVKLRNGSVVAINNTITPSNNPAPEVSNES